MAVIWDGDLETSYLGAPPFVLDGGAPYCGDGEVLTRGYMRGSPDTACKYIWVGLAGVFPLQAIRVFTPRGTEAIPRYTLGINDGDPLRFGDRQRTIQFYEGSGSTDYDVVTEVMENKSPVLEFEFAGEPVENIFFIAQVGSWRIAELEIYVDGFAVSSNYTSGVIDLAQFGTLGPLTWSGELHPGSSVDLRVRGGDTADPHVYFRNTFRGVERSRYNAEGRPLDRSTYLRLESGEQGGIAPDVRSWSAWQDVDFTRGIAEFSTRPSQYLQVRADFSFGRPARLRSVPRHPASGGDPHRGRDRTGPRPR